MIPLMPLTGTMAAAPSTTVEPVISLVPRSTTVTVSPAVRAAACPPSSYAVSRWTADSSVVTGTSSTGGRPGSPVAPSSCVVSRVRMEPASVPTRSWSEPSSNVTADAPGSSNCHWSARDSRS